MGKGCKDNKLSPEKNRANYYQKPTQTSWGTIGVKGIRSSRCYRERFEESTVQVQELVLDFSQLHCFGDSSPQESWIKQFCMIHHP